MCSVVCKDICMTYYVEGGGSTFGTRAMLMAMEVGLLDVLC